MGIFVAAFTIIMIFRDAVFDPKYRDWFLLKYVPAWSWQAWLIIGLAAILLLTLEASYNKQEGEQAKFRKRYRTRITELRRTHQEELTHARIEIMATSGATRHEQADLESQRISLEAIEQFYEIKKREPNLVRLSTEEVSVHNDENGIIVVGEINKAETFRAVVVPYHNSDDLKGRADSKRRIGAIQNVSAQINYRHKDSGNTLRIKRAAWLSEKDSRVDFGVNDTRRLIIVTVEGTDEPHVYAIRRDFDSSYKGSIVLREKLVEGLIAVDVRLVAEAESKPIGTYEFILKITREPHFEVELIFLPLWKLKHLGAFQKEGYQLSIRIYEGEKVEAIAREVKDWEARVANFIGEYFSEQQKTSFVDTHPSIEAVLAGGRRAIRFPPILPKGETRKEEFTPSFYTIHDSITARINKLKALIDRLV